MSENPQDFAQKPLQNGQNGTFMNSASGMTRSKLQKTFDKLGFFKVIDLGLAIQIPQGENFIQVTEHL